MRRWGLCGEPVLASPWRWVLVLLGLVFAMAAGSGISFEPIDWPGLCVGVVGAAVGLTLSTMGLLARVRLEGDRLVYRELWRRRTVPAETVQAVRVESVDDKVVWEVSAPVLHLRDGNSVALMALADISYGRWHTPLMRLTHEALLRWWGVSPI